MSYNNLKVLKTNYTLHNQPLETVQQAIFLGVEISADLSWSPYVSKVTSKASQSLGFLWRNFPLARPEIKQAAYTSIVRPTVTLNRRHTHLL